MPFKDYFSKQAACYQQARPHYPNELYTYLATLTPLHDIALDCATGNGQAALSLTKYYKFVLATDASQNQLKHACKHPKIAYILATAENLPIQNNCVDLVTVAQALHWFDFKKFYAELSRISKPNSIIAAWAYLLPRFIDAPLIDDLLKHYYSHTVGPYWPPERRHYENKYQSIPFPFEVINTPPFTMTYAWDFTQFTNYLFSWSATQRYMAERNENPIEKHLEPALRQVWQDFKEKNILEFELMLKVGRVKSRT